MTWAIVSDIAQAIFPNDKTEISPIIFALYSPIDLTVSLPKFKINKPWQKTILKTSKVTAIFEKDSKF